MPEQCDLVLCEVKVKAVVPRSLVALEEPKPLCQPVVAVRFHGAESDRFDDVPPLVGRNAIGRTVHLAKKGRVTLGPIAWIHDGEQLIQRNFIRLDHDVDGHTLEVLDRHHRGAALRDRSDDVLYPVLVGRRLDDLRPGLPPVKAFTEHGKEQPCPFKPVGFADLLLAGQRNHVTEQVGVASGVGSLEVGEGADDVDKVGQVGSGQHVGVALQNRVQSLPTPSTAMFALSVLNGAEYFAKLVRPSRVLDGAG